ncbi:Hly-III family protein [Roseivivax halodurans JCM 10272]|uniref:Hly-III family protein n=1 Tax=Roseivivax halodurans JCM 10272 TaxID=1449350 RepID=X7EEH0_9RHOB|nr:hemolysin III family protein [Roseivivax halodurans]ETX14469.1 Hly-III family protein [Roseivivax halodurans JCM 10272]
MSEADTPSAPPVPTGRSYTRAELASDVAVHLAGLVLALGAVPVLITLTAVWRGDAAGITGVSIYGATLILMLLCSLLYNHVGRPRWTDLFRRLDHSAIHFKIAGTYTPFALFSGAGSGLLTAIWTAAAGATALSFILRDRSTLLGIGIGLAMGWAVLVGGQDVLERLPWSVVVLMIVGGTLYSAGTIFLALQTVRYHNTIWHLFVVIASIVFFVAVFLAAALPIEGIAP